MKRIITASLVAAVALTSVQAESLSDRLSSLESELTKVKKKLKKQNKKINEVKAHDSGDNIKWGADVRTAWDNINYDMAGAGFDGKDSYSKDDLYSLRLWLNMAYAPNANNVFKGQLSMHKAFGADINDAFFTGRSGGGFNSFDWLNNSALRDDTLHVRQAYWLYLGENAFGADMPWTFSIGRRPSTNGFLSNLSQDDAAQSPLGHVINVQFDGLSSKLDLSKVAGVPGMSIKLCMGQGSTNATPRLNTATDYVNDDNQLVDDIGLYGFIFEPYNDGQYIVKSTWYNAMNVPDLINPMDASQGLESNGDMQGAALSVLVDGLTEEGYLADAKVFGSVAWTESDPDSGHTMFGSPDSESGTSYWLGAYLPVTDGENNYGTVGLEFNHGSQYWRPFTYAEDTMVGSKMAVRGDAWEANWTYQLTEALSMQLRYVKMDYEYSGSNGFFGSSTGTAMKIDDIKANAEAMASLLPTQFDDPSLWTATEAQAVQAVGFAANTVEAAEDFRFYIRYRF